MDEAVGVAIVAACDQGGSTAAGPAAATALVTSASTTPARFEAGHVVAYVDFNSVDYEWGGLLTPDGEFRLRVEGPEGVGSRFQLVGEIAIDGSRASIAGSVIAPSSRACS